MTLLNDKIQEKLAYCVEMETQALMDIISDARPGLTGPGRQFWFRYGPSGINPLNYGIHQALLHSIKRIEDPKLRIRALRWLVDQVHDTVACFWQAMATSGFPPGEGGRIENGRYVNADGDRLRHICIAGICDMARDPEMIATGLNVDAVKAMAIRLGEWLQGEFYTERGPKRKREIHRMGLPLNNLVAIYQLTGDRSWLHQAKWLLWWGWGDDVKRIIPNNGWSLATYDTGYPWEERGNYLGGDITSWPWCDGDFAEAALRMWPLVDEPTRGILEGRVLDISDWYVQPSLLPLMWDGERRNCKLHGGTPSSIDSWIRKNSVIHDPSHMIMTEAPQRILRTLYWHESDGRYMDKLLVTEDGTVWGSRDHHDDNNPLPRLKRDGAKVAQLLYARWLITRKDDDRLLALAYMFHYKGFANQSGHVLMPWSKASKDWYHDAAGKNRLLAWRFLCGWPIMKAEVSG